MRDLHPEVDPLTPDEAKWIKKLEKLLLSCPSDRLGLVTIGDTDLRVIDGRVAHRYDLELHDGLADRQGLVLATVRSKPIIHGVSG